MRRILLNWRHDLSLDTSNDFPFFGGITEMHLQSALFWLWRVSTIRLVINLIPGGMLSPLSIDREYAISVSGSDPTTRTDYQQISLGRRQFLAEDEVGDPATWDLEMGRFLAHDPAVEVPHLGWLLALRFTSHGSVFSTGGGFPTDATLNLTGTDPKTGHIHSNTIPIQATGLGATLTGSVSITPAGYYPYNNNAGEPLYDVTSGAVIGT
jgi:hypothetical protein